ERAARRRVPGVQHAAGDARNGRVRDRQRRAEVAAGVGAVGVGAVHGRRGGRRSDVAARAGAAEREPALRAVGRGALGDEGGARPWERGGAPAPRVSPPQVRLLMTVFEPSRVSPQLPVAALRTKSRNAPPTDIIVVVVVELVAVVVELVLVVGLVVVVVELVAVVVELVLVVGLVVLVVELVAVVVELVLVVGLVVLVVELVAVVVELVLVVGLVVVVVTPPLPVFTNLMH